MTIIRDNTIAVSSKTRWMLNKLAKASSGETRTDELAEMILVEWVKAHHPQLLAVWDERQALEDKALDCVKSKAHDNPLNDVPF